MIWARRSISKVHNQLLSSQMLMVAHLSKFSSACYPLKLGIASTPLLPSGLLRLSIVETRVSANRSLLTHNHSVVTHSPCKQIKAPPAQTRPSSLFRTSPVPPASAANTHHLRHPLRSHKPDCTLTDPSPWPALHATLSLPHRSTRQHHRVLSASAAHLDRVATQITNNPVDKDVKG